MSWRIARLDDDRAVLRQQDHDLHLSIKAI
jgi:hypothetical protein